MHRLPQIMLVLSGSISGSGTGPATISASIPRSGGFVGGTIDQLVTATGCPASSMAIWATLNGVFLGYIPGTSIVAPNAAVVGKCA